MSDPMSPASPVSTGGSTGVWWHAYGRISDLSEALDIDDDEPCQVFQLAIYSPSTMSPDQVPHELGGSPYLTSWDHAPSDAEKEAITPEEYREEVSSS